MGRAKSTGYGDPRAIFFQPECCQLGVVEKGAGRNEDVLEASEDPWSEDPWSEVVVVIVMRVVIVVTL